VMSVGPLIQIRTVWRPLKIDLSSIFSLTSVVILHWAGRWDVRGLSAKIETLVTLHNTLIT
ncbi:hypothetical protein L9F63_025678, partial [Diploptera punctata]